MKLLPLVTRMSILVLCLCSWPTLSEARPLSVDSCKEFYGELERMIEKEGVRNVSSLPVKDHPHLRTTRFLQEMRYFVTSPSQRDQWFQLLLENGKESITKEIETLSEEAVKKLSTHEVDNLHTMKTLFDDGQNKLQQTARQCSDILLVQTKNDRRFKHLPLAGEDLQEEYRTWKKILGLYPAFTPPIGMAIANYKRKVSKEYKRDLSSLEPEGTLTYFIPDTTEREKLGDMKPARDLAEASGNPLGIPLLNQETAKQFAHYYAPILEQEVTGDYDLPGHVLWEGKRIAINTHEPTVYYYVTHMIHLGEPLLQLNYVFWYSKRPRVYWIDVEAGRIHGMTLRVTLDRNGEPIMIDAIHNCGCYHFFFPSRHVFQETKRELLREDAFVPQWLPTFQEGSKLAIRIGTKKHFVKRVHDGQGLGSPQKHYKLLPYEILEALPGETGQKESIFTTDGIVKGDTKRAERYLLFSVGISEIGSMRQRGHQATSLIGERTFDDPRLFEHYFHHRK